MYAPTRHTAKATMLPVAPATRSWHEGRYSMCMSSRAIDPSGMGVASTRGGSGADPEHHSPVHASLIRSPKSVAATVVKMQMITNANIKRWMGSILLPKDIFHAVDDAESTDEPEDETGDEPEDESGDKSGDESEDDSEDDSEDESEDESEEDPEDEPEESSGQ
jgi:hypothetical protein